MLQEIKERFYNGLISTIYFVDENDMQQWRYLMFYANGNIEYEAYNKNNETYGVAKSFSEYYNGKISDLKSHKETLLLNGVDIAFKY